MAIYHGRDGKKYEPGEELKSGGEGRVCLINGQPKSVAKIYKPETDCGMLCDHTFIEAVQTGDPSKIKSPYEDAVKSVLFTLACNESMETGKPVKVNVNL